MLTPTPPPVFLLQSSDLGGCLSGLLERYQQYQDEAVSLHTWLSAQEQNQSIAGPSGETDTQTLQNTLRGIQVRETIEIDGVCKCAELFYTVYSCG